MEKKINLVIIGAGNFLTKELLNLLDQKNFPLGVLRLLSLKPLGKRMLSFKNADYAVDVASPTSFKGFNFAFLLESNEAIFDLIEGAKKVNCLVIDNTLQFAQDDKVPLIVPEVNPKKIFNNPGIIANPTAAAIFLALALKPIYNRVGINKLFATVFLSAAEEGEENIWKLRSQSLEFLHNEVLPKNIYADFKAFNLIPFKGDILENEYSQFENNLSQSLKKILQDNSLKFDITAVKVPYLRGCAFQVSLETKKKITAAEAKSAFSISPSLYLLDKEEEKKFLTPLTLQNKEIAYLGRVREISEENIISFWMIGDNIIKGGALNLLQIVNTYLEKSQKNKKLSSNNIF